MDVRKRKIGIFPKDISMTLVKKLKILDREKVFADVLARKEAFKDCENRKIRIFPKG